MKTLKLIYLNFFALAVVCCTGIHSPAYASGAVRPTPIALKKQRFYSTLLPAIEQQNQQITEHRSRLLALQAQANNLSHNDVSFVANMAASYGIKNFNPAATNDWRELLTRVDVLPGALVLAQAATESAWGTSRFAKEGNNYFGQWCYQKGCGIVPLRRAIGAHHEVKRFASVQQALASYFKNLNSNRAYRGLREIRAQLRQQGKPVTGDALSAGLNKYSERGQVYVDNLRRLIHNDAMLSSLDRLQFNREG